MPSLGADDPVMAWLLESTQPAMRYLASRDLLEPRPGTRVLATLQARVAETGWAAEILSRQQEGTWWGRKDTCYWPRQIGTIWSLQVLGDLGLTREDDRIANAAEHWFRLHLGEDGGYAPRGRGSPSHLCTTGNMARTLIRLGYERDERVQSALRWLVDAQLEGGGWDCHSPPESTLDGWEPMSAFAALAPARLSSDMREAVRRGGEFYLNHRLLHEGEPYPRWFRLHYPWHYWYDVLVGLDFMAALGFGREPRMQEALKLLRSKRGPEGRWALEGTNGKLRIEAPGRPSKMITFLALRVLKRIRQPFPSALR